MPQRQWPENGRGNTCFSLLSSARLTGDRSIAMSAGSSNTLPLPEDCFPAGQSGDCLWHKESLGRAKTWGRAGTEGGGLGPTLQVRGREVGGSRTPNLGEEGLSLNSRHLRFLPGWLTPQVSAGPCTPIKPGVCPSPNHGKVGQAWSKPFMDSVLGALVSAAASATWLIN